MAAPAKDSPLFFDCPSGRRLEYRYHGRCGESDPVLFVLHGMLPAGLGPASAAFKLTRKGPAKETLAEIDTLPFCIVCVARAGYDGSTPKDVKLLRRLTYKDVAADYIALIDSLSFPPLPSGVSSGSFRPFALSANSSGGMHALTVAWMAKERVTAMQLNCCDANYAPGYPKARKPNEGFSSKASSPKQDEVETFDRDDAGPDSLSGLMNAESITYMDQAGPQRPGMNCVNICCCYNPLCCCCMCCPKGMEMDRYVETRPVDYKYTEIHCDVQIIHGRKDDQVDPNVSRFHAREFMKARGLAAGKKSVRLHLVEGMGHCQMPAGVFTELMGELATMATGGVVQEKMA